MGTSGGTPAAIVSLTGNQLATGEGSMYRDAISSASVATTSGFLRLCMFVARKTETTTQVRMYTGGTAAAATPTLCRIGLYLFDAAGDATLVASTANDVTLFAAAATAYTRSWSVSYVKVAGQRYGLGPLVVTGAATPTFTGQSISPGAIFGETPVSGLVYTALADLPATLVGASGVANGSRPYGVVLP